ncbi:Cupredoxin [Cytidiella melzeri]|nr:Cupredoxin [Cytidiella melzeri]
MLSNTLMSFALVPWVLGAQFPVTVGGPGVLQFNPPVVNASVGDTVVFTFMQENHTASQSSFENPCQLAPNGFDSGFVPVADGDTGPFPVAEFVVEDLNPVWVYCRQIGHCQQGMVFAINPGDKFAAFKAAAQEAQTSSAASSVASSTSVQTSSTPLSAPTVVTSPAVSSASTSSPAVSRPMSSATTTSPSTVVITPSASPSEHLIVVGGPGKLFFSPSNISAAVGDIITFEFHPNNHTATQSTFANPCVSLTETSTSGQVGFDSGFMPVSTTASDFPTFQVTVNDTSPIWAFCRQANHCGQGMVFAVNAVESGPNNFAAYQARAAQLNGTNATTHSSNAVTGVVVGQPVGWLAAIAAVSVIFLVLA